MKRREFLGLAGAAALSPLAPGAARAQVADVDAPFAPVLSSPDRVIRTVVGLRPYRAPGYVLRADRVSRKTLVHNYGHGGAGVTMSWGCSTVAAELAAQARRSDVAVIGAGVMGLTTALLARRAGMEVTLYAEHLPPHTTSNIAGAFWFPSSLFDRNAASAAFLRQFPQLARYSQRAFQHYVNDPNYGVHWVRHHDLRSRPPRRINEEYPGGDALYPGRAVHSDPDRWFGFPYVTTYAALIIDPDIYLRALLRDVENAGVAIRRERFTDASEIMRLRERVIINCTGLGSGELFEDEHLTPVRGQLTHLLPQPEIDYSYVAGTPEGTLYMFPRQSSIVLGGTHEHGQTSTEIDEAQIERMLIGHAAVAAAAR